MKILSHILEFLFPASCPICACPVAEHGTMCAECWSKFNWISDPKCDICGYPFPADLDLGRRPLCPNCAIGANELDGLRSACVYDDASRDIMLPFKHSGKLKYTEIMTRAMIHAALDLNLKDFDVVIPIPLAYRRLLKRGYNQASLLARPIAKHFKLRLDTASIKRKYRPDMGHKNAAARRENIRGVFKVVRPKNIRGRKILLVDDVMTTGATFKEMYKVLKKAGAAEVYGITFCRVVSVI